MTAVSQPGHDWTVVLRRRPARIVAGQPEGGYTSMFEIICCYCGDDPELDYREVSPQLRRIRGPYVVAAGVTAYTRHLGRHRGPALAAGAAAADGPGALLAAPPA